MKKISILAISILFMILIYSPKVLATDTFEIVLSNEQIRVNGEVISTDSTNPIFLNYTTNNGGSSDNAKNANIDITNIININSSGTYSFTGNLSDGQIAIDANEIEGSVELILNNVDITCKKAPAIFIYNKTVGSNNCNVRIKTSKDSTNIISGTNLKQSVEGWDNQEELVYYIEKGYDYDNVYYERYKYDGTISSDISLILEGEGLLRINDAEKEGIEAKKDITINSGKYIINAKEDGINASLDNESIITINGGTLLLNLNKETIDGDAIDSNGIICINGGEVYAFSSGKGIDRGMDADHGIYINGGYVFSQGNMITEVRDGSKQDFIALGHRVAENETMMVVDDNKNVIANVKLDRAYSVALLSTSELQNGKLYIYKGEEIQYVRENGKYNNKLSDEELQKAKEIYEEINKQELANNEVEVNFIITTPQNNFIAFTDQEIVNMTHDINYLKAGKELIYIYIVVLFAIIGLGIAIILLLVYNKQKNKEVFSYGTRTN